MRPVATYRYGIPTEGLSIQSVRFDSDFGAVKTLSHSVFVRPRSIQPAPGTMTVSFDGTEGGMKSFVASPCVSM